ncbi:MAG TPA: hypothetical protein VF582_06130 [Allosphingosinicella sp.]
MLANLLAALIASTPLMAQAATPPSSKEGEIVVEGLRKPNEVINSYVRSVTEASSSEPLARYAAGEYCPTVIGLSAGRNAEIAARMRAVAAAAGVKPASAGCIPSALIFFVDDKEDFVREFRARHPIYFDHLQDEDRPALKAAGPALAWHLVQQIDPQGMPLNRDADGYKFVESSARGSNILSMISSVVAMSVVIVERSALVGLTATQIADYALMRTLTDRAPTPSTRVPDSLTILGALRAPIGSPVPASLTQWDLAYLKGRYSGHPARYGTSQAAAIRGNMRRALAHDVQK